MKGQNQFAIAEPRRVPWLAWIFLNFALVVLILPMFSAIVSAESDGGHSWRLPVVLGILLVAALWVCLNATSLPFRGRGDNRQLWKERFPGHTDQEIQRFLQTVGKALGYREQDWSKLGPEDDLSTLHHRWNGGDGMELVESVMGVEREYSLALPEEYLSTNKTLGDLFAYVTRPGADGSPSSDDSHKGRRP
ncbi:MAG: hypothetical protein KIS67_27615 [Verrucomicrobiae bacterium]|nr:hypothetical protein [Verrucomicrobiae bacterium]